MFESRRRHHFDLRRSGLRVVAHYLIGRDHVTASAFVDFPGARLAFCPSLVRIPSDKRCWIYGFNERSLRIYNRAVERFGHDRIAGFVSCHLEHSDIMGTPVMVLEDLNPREDVIMIADGPLWLPHVAPLIAAGHRELIVFNPLRSTGDITRMSIICEEIKTIFVPNLKVLYSSFREYFRSAFPEFAERPLSHDGLSSYEDVMSDRFSEFRKFSFVRNPFDRTVSCFREKLMRDAGHRNWILWNKPLQHLFGVDDVTFSEFVDFICRVPDSYVDPHLRSQHATLFCSDGSAVTDFVGRFESLESDLSRLSAFLGVNVNLPHKNQTNRGGETYTDFFDSTLRDKLSVRYRGDLESFGYGFG